MLPPVSVIVVEPRGFVILPSSSMSPPPVSLIWIWVAAWAWVSVVTWKSGDAAGVTATTRFTYGLLARIIL